MTVFSPLRESKILLEFSRMRSKVLSSMIYSGKLFSGLVTYLGTSRATRGSRLCFNVPSNRIIRVTHHVRVEAPRSSSLGSVTLYDCSPAGIARGCEIIGCLPGTGIILRINYLAFTR